MNYRNQDRRFARRGLSTLKTQSMVDIDMSQQKKTNTKRYYPDSLQYFHHQLNQLIARKQQNKREKQLFHKSVIEQEHYHTAQLAGIRRQLETVKSTLNQQKQIQSIDSKLQMILRDISTRSRDKRTIQIINPQPQVIPQMMPYMMPPSNYYPPPYQQNHRRIKTHYDQEEPSNFKPKSKYQRKDNIRRKLRKIFYVVAFTIFLRSQALKLTKVRRNNLKKFWLEAFDKQTNSIKNWLLQAHKYAFSIVLQKKDYEFSYEKQKSKKVAIQKYNLLLQLLHISLKQLLKQSTTQQISIFVESLENLCRNGSYAMSRFWTARQMQIMCISPYYGFIRVDQWGEKCLIGLFIFIKMLIYNMFLQPHKFDNINFKKGLQPLNQNMHLLGSVYYSLMKQVLNYYLQKRSNDKYYQYGNWLAVKEDFVIECCEPLVYGNVLPQDQLITGMVDQQILESIKNHNSEKWDICKDLMIQVIDKLHSLTLEKRKIVKKNLKYKLYN